MEDRYLYKAKTTPKEKGEFNNVWVTGNLIVSNGKYYIHPAGNVVNVKNETGRIIVMHEVIPDTICQCTGLKDKNGNLIWENDVIEVAEHEDAVNGLYGVIYCKHSHCYALERSIDFHYNFFTFSALNGFETSSNVIGNIFDNPELLESEE